MMTAQERLQEIQDAQGYVVVWTEREFNIGEVVPELDGWPADGMIPARVVVIGLATYQEHVKQVRRFIPQLKKTSKILKAPYYYKVIAE